MNIVSVCVTGLPVRRPSSNARRLKALSQILEEADRLWKGIDVVLLPGGYLAVAGNDCFYRAGREETLERHGICSALAEARQLLSRSRSVWLVVGVDSPAGGRFGGDQLCVAVGPRSRLQIARKIFPSAAQPTYACNAGDFDCPDRVLHLASGDRAVMAACYDMFGIADTAQRADKRRRQIHTILDDAQSAPGTLGPSRAARLDVHRQFIWETRPDLGLAAIHEFPASRGVVHWQRHGIAACAAAIKGIAIGAAHFGDTLPTPTRSTLAARRVPLSHLSMPDRTRRQAHSWAPKQHAYLQTLAGHALLRMFAAGR